jgi:POTRA domain, FtsQ-type
MTEQKTQPKEQIATHIYRRPEARELSATAVSASTHQRVVTRHREVQPTAGESYVQRRNRLYSARTKAPAHHAPTPRRARTLAQTGVPAVAGLKRPLPRYHHTPVPVRSGRRHTHRLGFLWRIFGFFAVVVMMILGANFALTSSAFRVAQVSVVGTHNDLLVSSIQHMGMQGQNIFLIDVVALTDRIEMLPVVASANLEKQWPNQLQVSVTERTPALLWQTSHGTYSVDRHGVVIAPASETMGADALMTVVDMPQRGKISGGRGTEIHPGVQLNAADIAFAMAVFAGLPKVAGITDFSLRYIDTMPAVLANMGGHGGYAVESKAGWTAYLGGANDANPLNNRLIELQQILTLAQREQLSLATIDLRFGLRPVYTLKQA